MVENTFGILLRPFRVLLGTVEKRPRVVRDIVFMYVVLHNMLRTHQGGADRTLTPENDAVTKRNGQVGCVPNEN